MDVQSVVTNFKNARLISRPFAFLAHQFHICKELHLHRYCAVALATSQRPPGILNEKCPEL